MGNVGIKDNGDNDEAGNNSFQQSEPPVRQKVPSQGFLAQRCLKHGNMNKRGWVDHEALKREAIARYGSADLRRTHGVSHWQRVEHWGLLIAEENGADPLAVFLFAWLHDSCRVNEHIDDNHGRRAAEYALTLKGRVFDLDDHAFGLLCRACREHTDGTLTTDPTIGACWDADRLELTRVNVIPDPRFMSTAQGKRFAEGSRWNSFGHQ